ncbi:MAG: hypothetical protein GWO76_00265 [Proteobacteria bacterium]|jgi:uncharacterized protein with NRDE domain|nr:hypothetical protein [Bacteroidota bacterium]NCF95794.1 hypothetical protein [Bacteroidota bacterium]NCG43535.1 hypothetical protein [Pseudomonadota bacterium]
MCIVSFLPTANGYQLTSNRDEDPNRRTDSPQPYNHQGKELTYPKDKLAGGTWIARHDGGCACLLNGADVKHTPRRTYGKSRGLLAIDLLLHGDQWFNALDMSDFEPFTLIHVSENPALSLKLYQWNGQHLNCQDLDSSVSHIWASSTLYSKEENQVIQDDFKQWLKSTPIDILNDVLSFHHAHQLHRKKVKTVSVCAVQSKQPGMHYQAF